jgi:hypothetical protein
MHEDTEPPTEDVIDEGHGNHIESFTIIQRTQLIVALILPAALLTQIYWAIAVQRGFKYAEASPSLNALGLSIMPFQRQSSIIHLHSHMEDISHPEANSSLDLQPPQIHQINSTSFSVWALADGHGGRDAAQFFIQKMTRNVHEIIHSKDCKNFSLCT